MGRGGLLSGLPYQSLPSLLFKLCRKDQFNPLLRFQRRLLACYSRYVENSASSRWCYLLLTKYFF